MDKNELNVLVEQINNSKNNKELKKVIDDFDLTRFSNKSNELYDFILENYKKVDENTLPYVLEYLYRSNNVMEFRLFELLIEETCKSIKFLTNLESILISEEKFLDLLPTAIKIMYEEDNGIADCMCLIVLNNRESYDKMTEEQINTIKDIVFDKLDKIISYLSYNEISNDIANSLGIYLDLSIYFNNKMILNNVRKCLNINESEVVLFAVLSLVCNNELIDTKYLINMAEGLDTCNRFYSILKQHGKENMFPTKYYNQEHIALANMASWLCYPTELGVLPDEILIVGTIDKDEYRYYICKFKSELEYFKEKGYMIGISGGYKINKLITLENNGHTFSEFESFDDSNYLSQAEKIIDLISYHYMNRDKE